MNHNVVNNPNIVNTMDQDAQLGITGTVTQADLAPLRDGARLGEFAVVYRVERLHQGGGYGDQDKHPLAWAVAVYVDNQLCRVRMENNLSIYEAPALHAGLLKEFEGVTSVNLDLEAVSEIDCAGLQLLLAAHKTAQTTGKSLTITGVSPRLAVIFEQAGLDPRKIFNITTEE